MLIVFWWIDMVAIQVQIEDVKAFFQRIDKDAARNDGGGKYNGIARYWRSWMCREEDLDGEFNDWICLCLTITLSPRTYPMSFHTLQISWSHHSGMFHSAFVFEHKHRIHECIFMHTVFVTLHICLHPTTFSGWQLVPHPSPTCLGAVAGWVWEHSDERSHEAASLIWNAGCESTKKHTFHRLTTRILWFSKKCFSLCFILMKHNQVSGFGKMFYQHFNQIPVVETSQWGSSQSWAYLLGAAWTGSWRVMAGSFYPNISFLKDICKSKWQDCFHCSMTRDHNWYITNHHEKPLAMIPD